MPLKHDAQALGACLLYTSGEELFHSFAGVPIIRKEDAVGVLCVQHAEPRRYEEVEIEALQTVAMVLSELIANAGLIDNAEARGSKVQNTAALRLNGLKLVDGMAKGHAVFHQPRITICLLYTSRCV